MVRDQPDATLEQLRQRGKAVPCSLKTLWFALDRLGLTRKKKSLHATQHNRPDVQKKRRRFRREVGQIEPKRLVFVDETGVATGVDAGLRPGTAGAAGHRLGPRLLGDSHGDCGLGAGRGPHPLAFPGSTDTAAFQTYVEQVLVPELHEGDVVVFDNLKPHLAAEVAKSNQGAGAKVLPLPP